MEVETVSKKLHELTEDELKQVTGGWGFQEYEVFLSESKNGEGEKQGYNVAFSPTLRDFLDRPPHLKAHCSIFISKHNLKSSHIERILSKDMGQLVGQLLWQYAEILADQQFLNTVFSSVRPQSRSSRALVQQALILFEKHIKNPEITPISGFALLLAIKAARKFVLPDGFYSL